VLSSCSIRRRLARLLLSTSAHADVSSWLFPGLGPSARWEEDGTASSYLSLQIDTGLGTDPSHPLIFGPLLRMQTHFGLTTDFALLARGATQGFVIGDWGLALDVGGYVRTTENHQGLVGSLVLGAPWGITLSVTGASAFDDRYLGSAVLGVDFARLTVYRTTGTTWWRNPNPAYRPEGY
jgi:hypothetical protein